MRVARQLRKRLTPQEAKLWVALRALRPAGVHFRRQVPIARYVVDFACLKSRLVVEIDGGQHGRDAHAEQDRERDAALAQLGCRVLRFWNAEVDRDLRSVMDTIHAALSPSPEGRAEQARSAARGGDATAEYPPPSGAAHLPPPPAGEEKRSASVNAAAAP